MQNWKREREKIKIVQDIGTISQNDPSEYKEMVRRQYERILAWKYPEDEEDQLLDKLWDVVCPSLDEDLKQIIGTKKSLRREGPNLVIKSLTTIGDLAKYLYQNSNNESMLDEDGLKNVSRLLGPNLEVLGGLAVYGIDITKSWVKRLHKKAPKVVALAQLTYDVLDVCCEEADDIEMDALFQMVEGPNPSEVNLNSRLVCSLPRRRFYGIRISVKKPRGRLDRVACFNLKSFNF